MATIRSYEQVCFLVYRCLGMPLFDFCLTAGPACFHALSYKQGYFEVIGRVSFNPRRAGPEIVWSDQHLEASLREKLRIFYIDDEVSIKEFWLPVKSRAPGKQTPFSHPFPFRKRIMKGPFIPKSFLSWTLPGAWLLDMK